MVEGKPQCEAWTIIPDGAAPNEGTITAAWTVGGVPHTLATHYVLGDTALRFAGFELSIDGKWARGTTCEEERLISWNGDELAVDTARWFASPDACKQAIDTGRPVAMDSSCFEVFAEVGDDLRAPKTRNTVRARSLTRFKRLLRNGGILYVVDEDDRGQLDCKPIKVAKGDGRHAGCRGSTR